MGRREPLRHAFIASRSGRVTEEHRLDHLVHGEDVEIRQGRYHYR